MILNLSYSLNLNGLATFSNRKELRSGRIIKVGGAPVGFCY
jgi:hypothetical protein